MSNISSLAQGLAQGLNGYLTKNQDQKRTQENQQQQEQLNEQGAQFQHNLDNPPDSGEGTQVMYMDPKMAEDALPGYGAKMVQDYNQRNPNAPLTVNQASDFLGKAQDLISKGQPKSTIKHHIGNDPDGNAIFADNNGNMTSPDGSKYMGKVLPKSSNMPTSSTRSSGEFATTILPHIQEMRQLISEADQKGFIGPVSGRVYNQFMAGKIGSTGNDEADHLLGKLRAMDSLLKTGAMRVHFGARGGANMYDHFSDMLNTGKQSAANLNGSLDTMEEFMQGYANAGKPGGNKAPTQSSGWSVVK